MAISSPLLEASIDGAHGVLLSVAGGSDLGLFEINEAAQLVAEAAHPEANIIFGAVIDDALGDEVRVTVIAAGFDGGAPRPARQARRGQAEAPTPALRARRRGGAAINISTAPAPRIEPAAPSASRARRIRRGEPSAPRPTRRARARRPPGGARRLATTRSRSAASPSSRSARSCSTMTPTNSTCRTS